VKILILSPYLPLPSQGGGGTTYFYYIKNLARSHEVHLACLVRQPPLEAPAELKEMCRGLYVLPVSKPLAYLNSLVAIFTGGPFRLAFYRSKAFERLVRQVMLREQFDIVIASHERMGQYVRRVKGEGRRVKEGLSHFTLHTSHFFSGPASVIDLHDVVSDRHLMLAGRVRNPILRIIHNWEARRLHAYEIECLRRFDAVWISTPAEADKLREFDVEHRLRVALRGIDLTDFPYGLERDDSRDIIFTGHMSYEPNVDAAVFYCNEIHARVKELLPEARTLLVGNFPHRKVLKAAHAQKDVLVTGRVPSVAEYLRRSGVFIAPLRIGTGARIKLLEAMAVGTPIVSTAVGCEGLGVKHEEHLLIADRPEDFAQAIKRLFEDRELGRRLSRNARKFVEEHYDLKLAAAEMESALREIRMTKPE
jgi:glycosyltransferase involved in cell wall biosynthesis